MTVPELTPYFDLGKMRPDDTLSVERFFDSLDALCREYKMLVNGVVAPLPEGQGSMMKVSSEDIANEVRSRYTDAASAVWELLSRHGLFGPLYPAFLDPNSEPDPGIHMCTVAYAHQAFWTLEPTEPELPRH